jgi:hypothetical protein
VKWQADFLSGVAAVLLGIVVLSLFSKVIAK